ncbi:Transcription initiation factor TFIID subunit 5 [Cucumispora dikerogammari]|nr:Transcription initiation factor TFIID subunit 5 [Cucumispora dikerogammari]
MERQTESIKNYKTLRNWVYSSLDQFKPELQPLLLPIFLHTYIGLVKECTNPNVFNTFFAPGLFEEMFDHIEERGGFNFKYFNNKIPPNTATENEFNLRPSCLKVNIYDLPQIFYNVFNEFQNPLITGPLTYDSLKYNAHVQEFQSTRFVVNTKRHAFALFLSFLEQQNFKDILNLVNERIEINLNSTPLVSRTIDPRKLHLNNNIFNEAAEKIYAKQKETEATRLPDKKSKEKFLNEFASPLSYSKVMYELMNIDDFCNRNEETFNVLAYSLNSVSGVDVSTCFVSDCGKLLCSGFDTGKILCFVSEELYEKGILKDIPNTADIIENKQQPAEKNKYMFRSFELVGHSSPIISIDVFPGLQNIVSGSFDGSVRVWSVSLKRCIGVYNAHKFPIYSVACMKQGLYFAVAGKMGFTVLYNLISTNPLRIFAQATPLIDPIESLISVRLIPQVSPLGDNTCTVFHPNGSYIFAASYKVLMYDINDGGLIREYIINSKDSNSKSAKVPDIFEYVTAMCVSHCGHFIAIGTNIGGLFLFNLEDNVLKSHWFFNNETIYSIAFTLKGNLLIGGKIFYSICLNTEKVNRYGLKGCTGMKVGFGYRNIVTVFAVKE